MPFARSSKQKIYAVTFLRFPYKNLLCNISSSRESDRLFFLNLRIAWYKPQDVKKDRLYQKCKQDFFFSLHDRLSASSSTSALEGFWSFLLNTTFPYLLNNSSYISSVSSFTSCKYMVYITYVSSMTIINHKKQFTKISKLNYKSIHLKLDASLNHCDYKFIQRRNK